MASRFDIAGPEVALRTETLEDLDLYYRARAKKQQEELAALEQAKYSGNEIYNVKPDEAFMKLDQQTQKSLGQPFKELITNSQKELESARNAYKATLDANNGNMDSPQSQKAYNDLIGIANKQANVVKTVNSYNKNKALYDEQFTEYSKSNTGTMDGNLLGTHKAFLTYRDKLLSGDTNATFDPGVRGDYIDHQDRMSKAVLARQLETQGNAADPSSAYFDKNTGHFITPANGVSGLTVTVRNGIKSMINNYISQPAVSQYAVDAVEYKMMYDGTLKDANKPSGDTKPKTIDGHYVNAKGNKVDKIEDAARVPVTNFEKNYAEWWEAKIGLTTDQATHYSKDQKYLVISQPVDYSGGKQIEEPVENLSLARTDFYPDGHANNVYKAVNGNITKEVISYGGKDYNSPEEFTKEYPIKVLNKSGANTGSYSFYKNKEEAIKAAGSNIEAMEKSYFTNTELKDAPKNTRIISKQDFLKDMTPQELQLYNDTHPGVIKNFKQVMNNVNQAPSATPTYLKSLYNGFIIDYDKLNASNENNQYINFKVAVPSTEQGLKLGKRLLEVNEQSSIELSTNSGNVRSKKALTNRIDLRKDATMTELVNALSKEYGVSAADIANNIVSTGVDAIDENGMWATFSINVGEDVVSGRKKVGTGETVDSSVSTKLASYQNILKVINKAKESGKPAATITDENGIEHIVTIGAGNKAYVEVNGTRLDVDKMEKDVIISSNYLKGIGSGVGAKNTTKMVNTNPNPTDF